MKRSALMFLMASGVAGCYSPAKLMVASPSPPKHVISKLQFSDSEIEGGYYFGDGEGVNCYLELDKDHTFTFRWHGCMGEYDRNSGPWHREGNLVVCEPTRPNKHDGFVGMDTRFVPVRLTTGLFLVEENSMPSFAANAGTDRSGLTDIHFSNDYVKTDQSSPVKAAPGGKPTMPPEYQEFYDRGPIRAQVTKVNSDGTVALDKGSKDRMHSGLRLATNLLDCIEVEVLEVGTDTSLAKPQYFTRSERLIKVGDVLSSGEGLGTSVQPAYRERFDHLPRSQK